MKRPTVNNKLESLQHLPQNNKSLFHSTRCCNCSYSSNSLSNKQFQHCNRNKALNFGLHLTQQGRRIEMAMAPLLQQPGQHMHTFQFPPEWQHHLQQIHPLQFQQHLQQMQPVQFIPQFQHQPPQMLPVQLRPQLPQLQQRAVQPAAEEQPPAPAVPQLPAQPDQPANHPAENIDLHHMAPMNNTCPHCGAKYFRES
eukprot:gene4024-biopygen2500